MKMCTLSTMLTWAPIAMPCARRRGRQRSRRSAPCHRAPHARFSVGAGAAPMRRVQGGATRCSTSPATAAYLNTAFASDAKKLPTTGAPLQRRASTADTLRRPRRTSSTEWKHRATAISAAVRKDTCACGHDWHHGSRSRAGPPQVNRRARAASCAAAPRAPRTGHPCGWSQGRSAVQHCRRLAAAQSQPLTKQAAAQQHQ